MWVTLARLLLLDGNISVQTLLCADSVGYLVELD